MPPTELGKLNSLHCLGEREGEEGDREGEANPTGPSPLPNGQQSKLLLLLPL